MMSSAFHFPPFEEDEGLRSLRENVRSFLGAERRNGGIPPAPAGFDPGFSQRLASQACAGRCKQANATRAHNTSRPRATGLAGSMSSRASSASSK